MVFQIFACFIYFLFFHRGCSSPASICSLFWTWDSYRTSRTATGKEKTQTKFKQDLTPIFTNITPWEQKKEAPCGKVAVEVAVVRKEEMYITPILLRVQKRLPKVVYKYIKWSKHIGERNKKLMFSRRLSANQIL